MIAVYVIAAVLAFDALVVLVLWLLAIRRERRAPRGQVIDLTAISRERRSRRRGIR